MSIAISVRNLQLGYRRRLSLGKRSIHPVLTDVSFDLHTGETLGILGRNGAGKSSLLKLLAGILDPDSGTITRYVLTTSLLSLNLGLDLNLSGEDNAILGGLLLGYSQRESRNNLGKIKEFSELGQAFYEPVKTYSSGMYARLGFSIAIHLQPDVLLIDEILGVGDAEFQKKSRAALAQRIHNGQTAVLVSHSTDQVRNLCKRAVWIEDGQVKMEGDAKPLLTAYEKYLVEPTGTQKA